MQTGGRVKSLGPLNGKYGSEFREGRLMTGILLTGAAFVEVAILAMGVRGMCVCVCLKKV